MHEEKQCQYCSEKFENQPALNHHLEAAHAELIKPPTPPAPSPEPHFADDDRLDSPVGGTPDDDVLVVGEHKKVSSSTPGRKSRKSDSQKSKPLSQRPGPKSSKNSAVRKSNSSKKPGIISSNDVITLSSDSEDEKDPEWRAPGPDKHSKRQSYGSTPTRKSSRKSTEFVVIVESNTDISENETSKKTSTSGDQTLTFMMGRTGNLVHVPSNSDPHRPDSLPMQEIMRAIKTRNLSDNTTIIIKDNKILSIKSSKEADQTKGTSLSNRETTKTKRPQDPPIRKWVRPVVPELIEIEEAASSSNSNKSSGGSQMKSKPQYMIAKKRTGGIPRADKDRVSVKPVSTGPIAKKRTGGSSTFYEGLKSSKTGRTMQNEQARQPRKSGLTVRTDPDDPLFVVTESTEIPVLSKPSVSFKLSPNINKAHKKKGKKKGKRKLYQTKSKAAKEKLKKRLQLEQAIRENETEMIEYENAPKRSLRIALKASVSDTTYEDGQMEDDVPAPTVDPLENIYPISNKPQKRGRPSNKPEEMLPTAPDDQVVMKAMVNGKWQDVVIGTKLSGDQQQQSVPVPSTSTSTSKRKYDKVSLNAKVTVPSFSMKGSTNAGRKSRAGRKPKFGAAESADCWRDDRYQYFSDGSRALGGVEGTSNLYSVPASESYGGVDKVEYAYGQEYGEDQDTVMPFSLSSYMTYQQDSPQLNEPEDHGLPVIVSAYHVDNASLNGNYDNSQNLYSSQIDEEEDTGVYQDNDGGDQIEEIPLRDPLAMDDGPTDEVEPEGEAPDTDPLGDSDHPEVQAPPPPPPVVVPQKGTKEEAKSALNNLRFVLSQITFKK